MLDSSEISFKPRAYFASKLFVWIIFAFWALGIWVILSAFGISLDGRLLVIVLSFGCLITALLYDFFRKRGFYRELTDVTNELDQASHAGELLDEPNFLEGRIAYEAVDHVSHLSGVEISSEKQIVEDYRKYIELWIHEVKTPIAAAKLALDHIQGDDADQLSSEIERIESSVEKALFYARASTLKNDYQLYSINLREIVNESLKRNRHLMIGNDIHIEVDVDPDLAVIIDEPWMIFMIGQVLVNSAKYGSKTIAISAEEKDAGTSCEHTLLEIKDDGWGIAASDLPRVFDRAFTGKNGRTQGNATGMGLYLCAAMCEQMGLGIKIASEEKTGTRVMFSFPHDKRLLRD